MLRLLAFVLLCSIEAVMHIGIFDVIGTENTTRSHILAASLLAIRDFNGGTQKAAASLIRTDENILSIIDHINRFETATAIVGPHQTQMTECKILYIFRFMYVGAHDLAVTVSVPAIFYGSSDPHFSEGKYYTDFVRVSPSDVMQGRALAEIIYNYYKWRYVVILTSPSTYWQAVTYGFTNAAESMHLHVHISMPLADGVDNLGYHLQKVKGTKHRIFILLLDAVDAARVLEEGSSMGLFHQGSQLLGPTSLSTDDMLQSLASRGVNAEVMKGFIGLQSTAVLSEIAGSAFLDSWQDQPPTMVSNDSIWCNNDTDVNGNYLYIDSTAPDNCLGLNFSSFAADGSDIAHLALYAYDATLTMLRSLEYLQDHSLAINRSSVFRYITQNVFDGVTGTIAYSQPQASMNYGSGDRSEGIYYTVVNYQSGEFRPIGQWSSDDGYTRCSGSTCYTPVYNTEDNNPPSDLAPPDIVDSSATRKTLLLVTSSVGILGGIIYASIVYTHRRSLIIKISQPALVGLNIVGCTLGCLRAMTAAFTLTDALCAADLWLGNLAFAIVVSALLMKTWRVHRVMNSGMKRIKISTNEVVLRTLGITMVIAVELAVWYVLEAPSVTFVTVDHHEHELQRKCESRETMYGSVMAMVVSSSQLVLLLLGVWYTYLTRHIPSGINDSFKIGQGRILIVTMFIMFHVVILSLVMICVAGIITVYTANLEPLDRQFIIAVLYLIAVYRCLYLLFADRVYYLFSGYELDSNFMLSKRAPSSKSLFAAISRQLSRQTSRMPGAAAVIGRKRLPSADDSVSISTKRLQLGATEKKAYSPEELEEQMILCKAKIAKYQCRLMEIQEIAVNQNYVFNYAVSENSNDEAEDVEADAIATRREKKQPEAIAENDAEFFGSEKSSITKVHSLEMQSMKQDSIKNLDDQISERDERDDDVEELESVRTSPARTLSARSSSVHPMSKRS